jgi:hypothetical protein
MASPGGEKCLRHKNKDEYLFDNIISITVGINKI